MKSSSDPIPETAIPELIRELGPIFGPQVSVTVSAPESKSLSLPSKADFVVGVRWQTALYQFAAEAKTRNTPSVLEEATRQARRWSAASGMLPMVIVPYLEEQRINALMQEEVSGLDLSGNGLVIVPGALLLRCSGQRNRYPESRPARFAYRGTTSVVPRAFLRRPTYDSVGQIQEETRKGGVEVALSTVSKALARMTDDMVIDRSGDGIVLLQADKLLEKLTENFTPPRIGRSMKAKLKGPLADAFRRVEGAPHARMVMSGASSQERYAAGMRADGQVLYCTNLDEVRRQMGDFLQPTERFDDITVAETADQTPFFDTRRDPSGVEYSSPVQTYLELAAGNERRDREIAQQVRQRILAELAP